MRASSPPHSAPDLFGPTCSLLLISTSSRSLRAREADAAVGPVPAVSRARGAPPALVLKLLRAWVSLNGLSGWGPTKGRCAGRLLCASSFAQALLRSFDAVVNHLQAALDATDAAAASLLRDHAALDDGNTRLGARLDRTLASNLIVLIQAHAEKSKVKCQESQPSKAFNGCKQPLILRELTMDFQWVQGTIDSEGTDRGHVEGG
uniref:Uncharacterized protein n=3 Tax=Oryza TaxID=4527 RepID=Q8W354_ORYSJ|nr:Hypothetical protein [Oryza sativa]AAP52060.1 hypothetical protein LOC_Os10g04990 [Oryza sativa Japonica Group]